MPKRPKPPPPRSPENFFLDRKIRAQLKHRRANLQIPCLGGPTSVSKIPTPILPSNSFWPEWVSGEFQKSKSGYTRPTHQPLLGELFSIIDHKSIFRTDVPISLWDRFRPRLSVNAKSPATPVALYRIDLPCGAVHSSFLKGDYMKTLYDAKRDVIYV